MTRRIERINNLLRQELGQMIQRQIKDPRLGSMVSVTEVVTSPDLSFAKVFVSGLGGEEERAATLKVLTAAAGFFRKELSQQLSFRRIPELAFHWDDSIERGARLSELFDRLSESRDRRA
ncbi:MAG: 30S ribosome-binding factor RbfA [Dehalococcoidia bacterium]|nr:30S ribosome-binding factor RbfA [Dehalococcoidia bacterium]